MSNVISEKYEFKAEVKQLLDILVHSLYTSREIFLRELISNASDALDKVRLEQRRGIEVCDPDLPFEIRIEFDEKNKIVRVIDTGIGMTKQEIIENIGTIAKSGSAEFIKQLKEHKEEANNIIGKFGVGFYSVFMVAEKVTIKTKSSKPQEPPYCWISDGLGEYELYQLDEKLSRGTIIEIQLKEDAKEFADKYRLEHIIKKHSNFISFPIYIDKEKINTVPALWKEPKSAIKHEQYVEFYKFLTHDTEEPMDIIHNSVDVPIQFNSLLFIPKYNFDFFGITRQDYGLDLFVRKVLIQHKNKDLLPEHLSFIKGVVDSEDLPLNISRETLQENIIFTKIANTVTKNVYSYLLDKAKNEPEKYNEFWRVHGRIFKLGYGDYSNQEKYLQLLRFNSSFNEDEKGLTSLEDYVFRMKEGQNEIYYIHGESREAINLDPHLELFRKKGIEVLYFYDPIDEFIVSSLRKFKDYEFKSVDSADTKSIEKIKDLEIKEEKKFEELSKDDALIFDSLLSKIKDILGDRVLEVKESKRLIDSAACLVNPGDSMTSSMKKILRMANKEVGIDKKIFEINRDHKLTRNLLKIFKKNPNNEFIINAVEQLFEAALLQEGSLTDPHKLVNRINKILEESSEWYSKLNNIS